MDAGNACAAYHDEHVRDKGISPNVASYVGATTVRVHELGYEDRAPDAEELERMQELVRAAMREGALGVGSSLIYAPAFYADTAELIALNQAAAEFDGKYISHMRSEGNRLLEAVDELIIIAREAGVPAEIYHLKAGGQENWPKMDEVISKVEAARAEGLRITADMYNYPAGSTGLDAAMPPWVVEAARAEGLRITADMYNYPAGSTGLDAAMPPWVQEGGYDSWAERLKDPATRVRVHAEMSTPTDDWENLMLAAGPEGTLLVGFRNEELRSSYTGKTLAAVAAERGSDPFTTAMDLVVEDGTRVQAVYFLMSEENIEKQIKLPWLSFGSDAGSMAPVDPFTRTSTHPRAYGNFSRLLGRYVRERNVISLQEAVRKLAALPAQNLGLDRRGSLQPGYYADVAIFDPETISDHATFEEPHQYSTGMVHVFVNGQQVLLDGEHTDALPGQVVRGPAWSPDDAH